MQLKKIGAVMLTFLKNCVYRASTSIALAKAQSEYEYQTHFYPLTCVQ